MNERAGRRYSEAMAADSPVPGAVANARLRAVRLRLLSLHKALVETERRRYQRAFGPIDGPQHALKLVMHDPWFAWLKPMGDLIVRIDEAMAADVPPAPRAVETLHRQVRDLLAHASADARFAREYRRSLQETPDVVVAHGQLSTLLDEFGIERRADERGKPPDR